MYLQQPKQVRLQSIPLASLNRLKAEPRHFEAVIDPRINVAIPQDVPHAFKVDPCHPDTTIVWIGECEIHLLFVHDDKLPVAHLVSECEAALADLGSWRARDFDWLGEVLALLLELVASGVDAVVLAECDLR